MTIQELYEQIDRHIAPFSLAEAWDNSGLLAGDPARVVTAALVCLDITAGTIAEAVSRGANVLVSHHPVIFHPLRRVLAGEPVHRLIREDLGAICCHTNLDLAQGGVNDCLARALGLRETGPLEPDPRGAGVSLGRVGTLEQPMEPEDFARFAARALTPSGGVRFAAGERAVSRVALCGGAGGGLAAAAKRRGADALVSGEIKHDEWLECAALGLTAVEAGHFDTECVVLAPLAERLALLAPGTPFLVSRQPSPVQWAAAR